MTHDQSFPGPSKLSVNKRVQVEDLPECKFGVVLHRMLHQIVSIRKRHPNVRILMGKYNIKAAYCRAHLSSATAAESLTVFNKKLLMALQMTLGGCPFPSRFGCISKTICDIANDLIQCKKWNHCEIFSPNQHLVKLAYHLANAVPFKQARELAVDLPVNDLGSVNVYIDNMPPICPDIGDNTK